MGPFLLDTSQIGLDFRRKIWGSVVDYVIFFSGCPSTGHGLCSKAICFDDLSMEYFLIVVAFSAGIAQHGVII